MHRNGFSFIEMSLVLALIAFFSLGSWSFIESNRHQEEIRTLTKFRILIETARTQALEQKKTIVICPTQDYKTCHPDWHHPLMAQEPQHKKIIAILTEPTISYQLNYHHFGSSPWFEFSPNTGSLASNGHWTYCLNHHCHQLIVNRAGHLRIQLTKEG